MKRTLLILALVSTVAGVASAELLRSPAAPRAAAEPTASLPLKATANTTANVPPTTRQEPTPARVTSTLVARQAPIPMLPGKRSPAAVAAADPGSARDPAPAKNAARGLTEQGLSEAGARTAIEADGYKAVRVVSKTADGTWRARALRGTTEVALQVDAQGNVIGE